MGLGKSCAVTEIPAVCCENSYRLPVTTYDVVHSDYSRHNYYKSYCCQNTTSQKDGCLIHVHCLILVEQGRGIEPLALAWKAKVLPLYEPCVELLTIQQSGTAVKIIWFPVEVTILCLPVISRVLYL